MLARLAEATGDVAVAQRWLELDPLHEPAHRELIRLYAARGDRAAALAQYRECVRTLSRELGVPPLAETTRLYEAISEGTLEAPAAPPAAARAGPAARAAGGARCRVGGAAGRLRRHRRRRARRAARGRGGDRQDAPGRGVSPRTRASAAPRCWAGARTRRRPRSPTGRWSRRCGGGCATTTRGSRASGTARCARRRGCCPTSAPTPPRRSTVPPRRRASSTACGRRSRPRRPGRCRAWWRSRTSQWADEATLGLLDLRPAPPGRAPAARAAGPHGRRCGGPPRSGAVIAARPAGQGRRRRAAALGGAGAVAGARAAPHEETEGLPFLLVEYLNSLGGDPDWALPAGARELLLARLDPVSETGRQVLAAAAAIGRSFDVDTVRAASGRGDEETVERARGARPPRPRARRALRLRLRPRAAAAAGRRRRRASRGGGCCTAAWPTRWRDPPPRSPATSASPAATPRRPPPTAAPPSTRARCSPTPRRSSTCAPRSRSATRSRARCTPPSATSRRCRASTPRRSRPTRRPRPTPPAPTRRDRAPARPGPPPPRRVGARHRSLRGRARRHAEDDLAARARICADLSLSAHDGGDPERAAELAERARALAEQAGDPRALGQAHNLLGALATSDGAAADALEHLGRSLAARRGHRRPGRPRRRAQQPRARPPRPRRPRAARWS